MKIGYAVFVFLDAKILELIHIPTALEAKVLEQAKRRGLVQQGDREHPGGRNEIVGIVCLIDGNGDPKGLGGDLHHGIDDAATAMCAVLGGKHIEPAGEIVENLCIHNETPFG